LEGCFNGHPQQPPPPVHPSPASYLSKAWRDSHPCSHPPARRCLVAVVHSLYTKRIIWDNPKTFTKQGGLQKFYTHQFAKYNYKGEITHITPEFQFEHNGIEFAAGLVEKGDDFIVSYGKDDLSSHIAIIPKDIVLNSLEEIPYR
jgi:hypothetical protein